MRESEYISRSARPAQNSHIFMYLLNKKPPKIYQELKKKPLKNIFRNES